MTTSRELALKEMPSPKMQTCLAPEWYVKHYATIKEALQQTHKPMSVMKEAFDALDILEECEDIGREITIPIRTALQTRTPPVPVDTIAVPREVLQGVREALKFYARHEHWMAFDDTDPMRRVLTAMKNSKAGNQDGWEQAEEILSSLDAVLSEGK